MICDEGKITGLLAFIRMGAEEGIRSLRSQEAFPRNEKTLVRINQMSGKGTF